jgi:hypothetical protein
LVGSAANAAVKKERSIMEDAPLGVEFPGRVLLSRAAIGHSTIGAEGLNCRVRDGNGCYTLAVATGKFAVLIFDLRTGEISD